MVAVSRVVTNAPFLLVLLVNAIVSLCAPVGSVLPKACRVCGPPVSYGFKATVYSYASPWPDFNALVDFSKIGVPWYVSNGVVDPNYSYRDGKNWVYVPWFQSRVTGDYLYDAFIFGGNDYRVEYTGWFKATMSGYYTFTINFDEGAGAAISIGGGSNCYSTNFKSVVAQPSQVSVNSNLPVVLSVNLVKGQYYPLEISYLKASTPAPEVFSIQYSDPHGEIFTTFENVFNFDQVYCPSSYLLPE